MTITHKGGIHLQQHAEVPAARNTLSSHSFKTKLTLHMEAPAARRNIRRGAREGESERGHRFLDAPVRPPSSRTCQPADVL